MTVIAIDPGGSTGVAIHRTGVKCPTCHGPFGEFYYNLQPACTTGCSSEGFLPDEYLMLVVTEPVKLWDIIQSHKPTVIVCENFASGGLISKDGQATIRLVGALELAAYITGATLVLQAPQERYRFMDTARDMLRQRGKTPISHEVDSLAHLLLYEWRQANQLDAGLRRHTWQR